MTPCLTYPACLDKRDCPFKHPESSLNFFAQAPEKCLNSDSNLPSGCHEVNGTVYFPLPINLLPQSNPATPDTRYVFATPQGYEFVPSPGAAPLPWTAVCPGTAETSHEVFSSTEATIPNFTPTQANFTIPSLESSSTHSGHKPCALDALAILPPNPPTANTGFHQPPAPEGSIISLVQNSILREGSQMCC
ncbi:hypothetical protein OF83DRAFT_460435 [Amylostereum chailletii]|nr:hypothetical protein OF83DRAFT_460435 [Amylostereum chailletii]